MMQQNRTLLQSHICNVDYFLLQACLAQTNKFKFPTKEEEKKQFPFLFKGQSMGLGQKHTAMSM